ncbi:MAG: ribosome maturation factor RimP [Acidobacteria bacterium]|nr:ribosome maturation factor RimP [Acidobacteriota bacterium]
MAARTAQAFGFEVFALERKRERGGDVLRVVLDRPWPGADAERGVTLHDCERVSHELSTVLDVEDLLPDRYTLEVSSPGLDRPLRHADDYRRFAGRRAKVVLTEPLNRQTAYAGRLRGIDGEDVLFESEGGKPVRLPLRLISRARLDVEF